MFCFIFFFWWLDYRIYFLIEWLCTYICACVSSETNILIYILKKNSKWIIQFWFHLKLLASFLFNISSIRILFANKIIRILYIKIQGTEAAKNISSVSGNGFIHGFVGPTRVISKIIDITTTILIKIQVK